MTRQLDSEYLRIAIVMTCHNRRTATLSCLRALSQMTLGPNQNLFIFLVDDGSSDGTTESVHYEFPSVHIISGDGSLFWNGGMRVAFGKALKQDFDFYLWLNDDTNLYPDAIQTLLTVWQQNQSSDDSIKTIIVGSTRDPDTGEYNYGGAVRTNSWHPLKFSKAPPRDFPIPCATFCGNCVLVPRNVALCLGNLDAAFTHLMGDTDYGLRARKEGIQIWIAPGFQGDCPSNPQGDFITDSNIRFRDRVTITLSPKGLPPREWGLLARRHGGLLWPIFAILPYLRFLSQSVMTDLRALFTGRVREIG